MSILGRGAPVKRSSVAAATLLIGAAVLVALELAQSLGGRGLTLTVAGQIPGFSMVFRVTPLGCVMLEFSLLVAVGALATRGEGISLIRLLGLIVGVALVASAGNTTPLLVGAELIWFATSVANPWPGLAAQQFGNAFMIAAGIAFQNQAGTTDFSALQAGASDTGLLLWAAALVLWVCAAAMDPRLSLGSPITGHLIGLFPLLVIAAIRFTQAAQGEIPNGALYLLLAAALVLAGAAGVGTLISRSFAAMAQWIWVGSLGAILALAATTTQGSPTSLAMLCAACAVSGILLWTATAQTRGVGRSVTTVMAGGAPGGLMFSAWVVCDLTLWQSGGAAAFAGGTLVVFQLLTLMTVTLRSADGNTAGTGTPRRWRWVIPWGVLLIACLPGALLGPILGWMVDGPAAATGLMAVPLPTGEWPSGWVSVASVLLIAAASAVAVILGFPRGRSRPSVLSSHPSGGLHEKMSPLLRNAAGRARALVTLVDENLQTQPRLVSVFGIGVIALMVLR